MCEKKQHNSVGAPSLDSLTAFIAYTQHSVFRNQHLQLQSIAYPHGNIVRPSHYHIVREGRVGVSVT